MVKGKEMTLEERDKRIAELVDLLGPTDIFDLFYKKTDVALVAIAKVFPSRQRGELLVRAVSRSCNTETKLIRAVS
jgi:hypothetical protein